MPYQPDAAAALQALREDVFRRGDYYRFEGSPEPATIEELIANQEEDGTHSILDVSRVADEPGPDAVAPVPTDDLTAIFGTMTPSRAQIEAHSKELDRLAEDAIDLNERWGGLYVVAYRDGQPDELFFFGISGD